MCEELPDQKATVVFSKAIGRKDALEGELQMQRVVRLPVLIGSWESAGTKGSWGGDLEKGHIATLWSAIKLCREWMLELLQAIGVLKLLKNHREHRTKGGEARRGDYIWISREDRERG